MSNPTPPEVTSTKPEERLHEPEHKGPVAKHPYVLYGILNAVIFGLMILVAYFFWSSGSIPRR